MYMVVLHTDRSIFYYKGKLLVSKNKEWAEISPWYSSDN